MSKLVILNLGQGNLQHGFPSLVVRLQSEEDLQGMQFSGSLPAAPELGEYYDRWQLVYDLLYQSRCLEFRGQEPPLSNQELIIDETDVTQVSETKFEQVSQQLQIYLDAWLDSEGFRPIERQLRSRLHPQEEIRFIIQTDDKQLRQLPWYIWQFFQDYSCAEASLSSLNFEPKTTTRNVCPQVRILCILGDATGIDIEVDKRLLADLPEAQTTFLVEPTRREVFEKLWAEQGWDILFFAGHSLTYPSEETGQIYINPEDSLTISQLRNALRQAIAKGLQLAIFNSCDGLGLARQLAEENIPQTIVMREPVPDQVAQEFLKYFLSEFAGGQNFDWSVRQARERLQGMEGEFPGASWLPVIFQNPAQSSPRWQGLCRSQESKTKVLREKIPSFVSSKKFSWFRSIRTSLLATSLVVALRWLGMLQFFELQAFDHLMRQRRPYEKPDDRLLIVQATPEDLQTQEVKPQNNASLSDHTLTQVLAELQQYEPVAIGLDIYRDFPVDSNSPELIKYLAQENLFGICKVRDPDVGDRTGVAPPPEIPPERLSFSDALADTDGTLRRHLLSMKSRDLSDPCTAQNSLSFLLALFYLDQKGIQWEYTANQQLQINNPPLAKSVLLPELQPFSGGYQKLDARGRQILLNYRSLPSPLLIAHTVTVGDILHERIPAKTRSKLKNRLILVGIAGSINTSADYWLTPYSASQPGYEKKIPGLFIQGHMVSQILSAVLDDRPLLWVLPWWGEVLWILAWSVVVAVLSYLIYQPRRFLLAVAIVSISLYGVCYIFFLSGGWLPLIPSLIVVVITAIGIIVVPRDHQETKAS